MPSSQTARRSWPRQAPGCRRHSGHEAQKPRHGQRTQWTDPPSPGPRLRRVGYAEQLANAVAASYVRYTGQLAATSAGPQVAALQQQSAQLTKQINDLQTQIDHCFCTYRLGAFRVGRRPARCKPVELTSERAESVIQELNSVTSQISSAQLASGSAANTIRILQTAAAVPVDKVRPPVTAGIVGFAIGLFAARCSCSSASNAIVVCAFGMRLHGQLGPRSLPRLRLPAAPRPPPGENFSTAGRVPLTSGRCGTSCTHS